MQSLPEVNVAFDIGGRVNGSPISLDGVASGRFGSGTPRAVVNAREPLPAGFHISMLSYVVLTGQPSMSKVMPGAVNPFLITGGVYEATRTLDLGDHGYLSTEYRVESVDEGLAATFDITGDVHVPALTSIAPTIETWVPRGPGRVSGHFTMVWTGADDTQVKGEAATDYRLPLDDTIPQVQFREIRIGLSCSETHLEQNEQIVIFTPDLLADIFAREVTPTTTAALV